MKNSLIAVLALGVFAAMAQAGTFLTNPIPLVDPLNPSAILTDSMALIAGGPGTYSDPVNGGIFSTDGVEISNFEAYVVAQLGPDINTPYTPLTGQFDHSAVSLPGGASASLYLANLSGDGNWYNVNTMAAAAGSTMPWSASFDRMYYSDGSNYYSSNWAAGNYLPMYELNFAGGGFNLAAGTYAWAVLPANINFALLTSSYSACSNAYNAVTNAITCDIGGGIGNAVGFFGVADNTLYSGGTPYGYQPDANGPIYMVDTNYALSPEPGTWLLIAAGAGVLALARRRKV